MAAPTKEGAPWDSYCYSSCSPSSSEGPASSSRASSGRSSSPSPSSSPAPSPASVPDARYESAANGDGPPSRSRSRFGGQRRLQFVVAGVGPEGLLLELERLVSAGGEPLVAQRLGEEPLRRPPIGLDAPPAQHDVAVLAGAEGERHGVRSGVRHPK